ncbi:MAG: vitamin K epoxide reductase family protein [Labedaea sp.]
MAAREDDSPSAWTRRVPVAALAVAGCLVSVYLALYQYQELDRVWDPVFGAGSERVLTSPLSRALPISDAALGAVAYLAEAVLEVAGGRRRWRERSWVVLLLGITAAALAVVGVGLVISQPVLAHGFCTLCLTSAAISMVVAALVRTEVLAAWRVVRQRRRDGQTLPQALCVTNHPTTTRPRAGDARRAR